MEVTSCVKFLPWLLHSDGLQLLFSNFFHDYKLPSWRHRMLKGRWSNRMVKSGAKYSILQGISLRSGSKQNSLASGRHWNWSHLLGHHPLQAYVSNLRQREFPRRSIEQSCCLGEALTGWANMQRTLQTTELPTSCVVASRFPVFIWAVPHAAVDFGDETVFELLLLL